MVDERSRVERLSTLACTTMRAVFLLVVLVMAAGALAESLENIVQFDQGVEQFQRLLTPEQIKTQNELIVKYSKMKLAVIEKCLKEIKFPAYNKRGTIGLVHPGNIRLLRCEGTKLLLDKTEGLLPKFEGKFGEIVRLIENGIFNVVIKRPTKDDVYNVLHGGYWLDGVLGVRKYRAIKLVQAIKRSE